MLFMSEKVVVIWMYSDYTYFDSSQKIVKTLSMFSAPSRSEDIGAHFAIDEDTYDLVTERVHNVNDILSL